MKRKGRIYFFVLLTFISLAAYAFTPNIIDENERKALYSALAQEILRYERGEASCVDSNKATTFVWDKLYIFRPYRSSKEIENILGTFWPGSRFSSIRSDDRITLLVFVRNGKVVQYLDFSRGLADFASADNGQGYDAKQSCFIKNDKGKMVLSNTNR